MSEARASPGGWRGLALPALAALGVLAVLLSLGWWQLERKAWKEGLLRQIEARAHGAPGEIVPAAEWLNWRGAEDEYRRVRLAGTSQPDRLVALNGLAELRPRQATQGFYFFVPMRLPGGETVLVNRGFAATEEREAAERALRSEAPERTIVGLVRTPETRGWFVPENAPRRDSWWVRDITEMARARDLHRIAPFYVDADDTPNPGGWPKGGQTQLVLRNTHLQYALTWFGLAATLIGVFAAFARARLRDTRVS